MMESWGPGRTGTPPPALPPPPAGGNNGGATSAATATVAQPSTTAPIASPEGVSDVSGKTVTRQNFQFQNYFPKIISLPSLPYSSFSIANIILKFILKLVTKQSSNRRFIKEEGRGGGGRRKEKKKIPRMISRNERKSKFVGNNTLETLARFSKAVQRSELMAHT